MRRTVTLSHWPSIDRVPGNRKTPTGKHLTCSSQRSVPALQKKHVLYTLVGTGISAAAPHSSSGARLSP
jgi:hypothetical protein